LLLTTCGNVDSCAGALFATAKDDKEVLVGPGTEVGKNESGDVLTPSPLS
jgi:hypothetical protein